MYNVSENYIAAVRANTRTDRLLCTLTFPDDPTHPVSLTDADYGQGSISITWQCVDGEELMFGAAIAASMDISIRSSVNRYRFYGATLEPVYQVKTGTNTWESVPLGIFTVSEAERVGSLVTIDALDNMQKFDKEYGSAVLQGSPYEILAMICEYVGVTIGTTSAEIEDWPNATTQLQIDATNGCSTYRDALKAICQLLGAYAMVNRAGQLVVRQFHTTADTSLDKTDRYSSVIADYTCLYAGLSVTGLAGTFTKYDETVEDGLIMTMSDAMAWDSGDDNLLKNRVNAIFDLLQTIEYTPSEVSMPGDPSFDCGDMVELILDDEGNDTVNTIITEINWSYRQPMSWESVGQNPYVTGAVGSASRSNRMLSLQGEQNKIVMFTVRNAEEIIASDTEKTLCKVSFATFSATEALFYASILMEVTPSSPDYKEVTVDQHFIDSANNQVNLTGLSAETGKVVLNVTYLLNNEIVPYDVKQIFISGKHAYVLFYPIMGLEAQTLYNWEVKVSVSGGSISVPEDGLRAILWGQNIVASQIPWDGNITVLERIEPTDLLNVANQFSVVPLRDFAAFHQFPLTRETAIERIPVIEKAPISLTVESMMDIVAVTRLLLYYTITYQRAAYYTYNPKYVTLVQDFFVLNSTFVDVSSYATIDSGALKKCDCDVTDITPTSIAVTTSGEGGSGRPSLPSAYQEVEYISTNGNQYIDTGYTPTDKTRIVVDAQETAAASYPRIFCTGNGNYTGVGQVVMGIESSSLIYIKVCADGSYYASNVRRDYMRHIYEIDKNVAKIDDTAIYTGSSGTATSGAYVRLMGSGASSSNLIGNLYLAEIYEDGVLQKSLVPCYRKADSVVGLYDTVNDQFHTPNVGTLGHGADVNRAVYKTLITDGTDVYSISSGTLTASVGLLANIDAQMFEDYGFDGVSDCDDAVADLIAMGEFSILRWCSNADETSSVMTVTVTGVPDTQDITIPSVNIADSHVISVESIEVTYNGNPQIAIKFDNGAWEYYDTSDEDWCEVGTGTVGYMTVATMASLPQAIWTAKFTGVTTIQARLTITTMQDGVKEIKFTFIQEE